MKIEGIVENHFEIIKVLWPFFRRYKYKQRSETMTIIDDVIYTFETLVYRSVSGHSNIMFAQIL